MIYLIQHFEADFLWKFQTQSKIQVRHKPACLAIETSWDIDFFSDCKLSFYTFHGAKNKGADQTARMQTDPQLCWFCLFDLIIYIPVNNFSVMSGRVFLG